MRYKLALGAVGIKIISLGVALYFFEEGCYQFNKEIESAETTQNSSKLEEAIISDLNYIPKIKSSTSELSFSEESYRD